MLQHVDTHVYQTHFVEEIEHHLGRPLQLNLRHAFLQIPRHFFIEHAYHQRGNSLTWDLVKAPALEDIYCDQAVVTKIDAQGRPICSSSQPSLMALQLEALDLHHGHIALEIGTGTGYNAALMSRLVDRTGQVVSLDIDEQLVSMAHHHLHQAGVENVHVVQGDGADGYDLSLPYDRLLATCGVTSLPRPWLFQLKQGGMLLCNLLFPLASTFIHLQKTDATTLIGGFLDINGRYMQMQGPDGLPPLKRGINWKKYDALASRDVTLAENLTELLSNVAYSLLLQCLVPVRKHYRWDKYHDQPDVYLLEQTGSSAVRIRGDRITIYGDGEYLEQQIQRSLCLYECLRPSLADYQVHLRAEQATLTLADQTFSLSI
jgi:protein-L-isoaspartate(D-aspartate) O-methyltransferase